MRSKFSVSILIILSTLFYFGCSSNGVSASDETISLTAIAGVTAPVIGATPVTTIDASQYAGTISWNPAVSGTFTTATVYTATITLKAKPGFTFSGVSVNSFTVAGANATNKAESGVVTAVFPSTSAATINLTTIPGVITPVTGGVPVTTLDASQYTGAISWNPVVSGTFAVGIAYTATITLTPKPGFTCTGTAANSFTVAGATATNTADSGVVSAAFPVTTVVTVYLTAIPGVPAPATGYAPVTTLDANQYTGTISWNPTVSDTFAAETAYTATISLTPKTGLILTGVATNGFTVAGSSATNAADSGVVSATFPKTGICKLINVPAGRFQRDDVAANISEVSAFRMSEFEITRSQFKKIMSGNDPSEYTPSGGANQPVQQVIWYMAIAFCNKLSIAEGLDPVYAVSGVNFNELAYANVPTQNTETWNMVTMNWNNNGYRLPTDMEWKWAAMGAPASGQNGSTNTMGRYKAYAGSTEGSARTKIRDYAQVDDIQDVGKKLPNELGFYDLTGNVAEWCWDWEPNRAKPGEPRAYPAGLLKDYQGAANGSPWSARMHNGGNYSSDPSAMTIMYISASLPEEIWRGFGLRVVRR